MRGSLCTEELLKSGYAVIFLYRKGSIFPFTSKIYNDLFNNPIDALNNKYDNEDKNI